MASGDRVECYLLPLAGPPIKALKLAPKGDGAGTLLIGRHPSCDLRLPAYEGALELPHVSRS